MLVLLVHGVGMGAGGDPTVPDQPGLEFTMSANRLHFTAEENRQHFTVRPNRMHFAAEEED